MLTQLLALGLAQQARASYLKALALREQLSAGYPNRADYQCDLSVSFDRIGDMNTAVGQLEEARTAYFKVA